ncbi:drug resistance transporter, EmrB/QacA subfamily [Raineyella antarctica]|uniref:Drug resistance transporter, EmrB/QacA subfamily n=1 Tax=Raineyella antarctica TaxID=1577474 RepID=A0A1G6GNK3_9ACTN|nr:MFS transporter [Raineyella antarctica]SDB83433.1 drug resistance transporter, EmrB/QacA subfamily [Raineyella antarctica]
MVRSAQDDPAGTPGPSLARGSRRGRLTLAAVTLGSGIALLDGTVVTIALPTIGRELGSSLGGLQWVNNGYLLALASLILVGGSLGDRLGRRRIYLVGVVWFALASAGCALAPSTEWLVAARILQGIGAALLTPGGLAIIQASFRPEDRAGAIGAWAGVSGTASAAGPFVGGWVLAHLGWPGIFLINVPLCALVVGLALVAVPETRDTHVQGRAAFDLPGAGLTLVLLSITTFLLISGSALPTAGLVAGVLVAAVAGVAFIAVERRARSPLVPLALFSSRVFSTANLMTFLVYGALGAVGFFLVLQLQTSAGFTPLESGLANLPTTVLLLLFSSRMAVLARRTGPRLPMSAGPLVCAVGVLWLSRVGAGSGWGIVLGAMSVFGLGLTILVAPLTAAVLAAAPDRFTGAASGINNAVARTGALLAIAALPALVGLAGSDYRDPDVFTAGYRTASYVIAGLLTAGGLVSWLGLGGSAKIVTPAAGRE